MAPRPGLGQAGSPCIRACNDHIESGTGLAGNPVNTPLNPGSVNWFLYHIDMNSMVNQVPIICMDRLQASLSVVSLGRLSASLTNREAPTPVQ